MNKLQIYDRVKFSGSLTGTGALSVSSAEAGFQAPADTGAAEAEWWPFLIHDEATDDWELGIYQEQTNFNLSFDRSSAQVVLASSNSGSAVNFGSGALTTVVVSLVDPALLVEAPQRYFDISSGTINAVGALRSHGGLTTRFPLVSAAFDGFVDGLAAEAATGTQGHVEQIAKTIVTTDATATAVAVFEIPSVPCIVVVEGVAAFQDGSGNSRAQTFRGCAHYDGSTAELLGTPSITEVANDTSVTAAISVDYSAGLRVVATGVGATTFTWVVNATATYMEV